MIAPNNKKKITSGLCLFLSTVLLSSCHPVIGLEVTNNTGEEITVVSDNLDGHEATCLLANGQTSGVKVAARMRVKHGHGVWDYDFTPPPALNLMKKLRMNVYVERVQIEKGGTIYLLGPDLRGGPGAELPAQPAGYPIQPK